MKKYMKKPIEVEVWQFTQENINKNYGTNGTDWFIDLFMNSKHDERFTYIDIETLEGTMRAELGDYIIKGIHGEFYPCKPDIFDETYERVEE